MDSVSHWRALIVLGTAQFLMVLDTFVMNVSISRLVEDFDTDVTAIQAVITLYALVMAAFTGFNASAQLDGLKAAVLATGGITPVGFLATGAGASAGHAEPSHLPAAPASRPPGPDTRTPAPAGGRGTRFGRESR
jgi:predicted MFS family arabinose efflux permease